MVNFNMITGFKHGLNIRGCFFSPLLEAGVPEGLGGGGPALSHGTFDLLALDQCANNQDLISTFSGQCFQVLGVKELRFYSILTVENQRRIKTHSIWRDNGGQVEMVRATPEITHFALSQDIDQLNSREIIALLLKNPGPISHLLCRTEADDPMGSESRHKGPFVMFRLDIMSNPGFFIKMTFASPEDLQKKTELLNAVLMPYLRLKLTTLQLQDIADDYARYRRDANTFRELVHLARDICVKTGGFGRNSKKILEMISTTGQTAPEQLASLITNNNIIIEEAGHGEALIKTLQGNLDLTREPVDLRSLINVRLMVVSNDLAKKDIRMVFDQPQADLPPAFIYREAFGEALTNLFNNAVYAMAPGGLLKVTLRYDKATGVFTIKVKDTGPGIPKKIRQYVFDPGFSTKGAEGTGTGLAQVLKTLKEVDWQIKIVSPPGQGATFILTSPAKITSTDR